MAGLIALSDPPRTDSAALVKELAALGVRIIIVTGDADRTARVVAASVGIKGQVWAGTPLPSAIKAEDFAIFAGGGDPRLWRPGGVLRRARAAASLELAARALAAALLGGGPGSGQYAGYQRYTDGALAIRDIGRRRGCGDCVRFCAGCCESPAVPSTANSLIRA